MCSDGRDHRIGASRISPACAANDVTGLRSKRASDAGSRPAPEAPPLARPLRTQVSAGVALAQAIPEDHIAQGTEDGLAAPIARRLEAAVGDQVDISRGVSGAAVTLHPAQEHRLPRSALNAGQRARAGP